MVSVQQLVNYCLVILVLPGSDVGVMVGCVVLNAPSKQLKDLICLGCLSCHHMMSVCLPVKMLVLLVTTSSFESTVNVKTLERCFNERIERERAKLLIQFKTGH